MSELAHVRERDTLLVTFNAGTEELLNAADVGITTEADVGILATATYPWMVPIAHVVSEGTAHVRYSKVYNAPQVDYLVNASDVQIVTEADVEILSENVLTPYVVELIHV